MEAKESEIVIDRDLVVGWLKPIAKQSNLIIPQAIIEIIRLYNHRLTIYGIGQNQFDQFGFQKRQNKFVRLFDLERLITNTNQIYCNYYSILAQTASNDLFVCGYNQWSRLGLETKMPTKSISKYTQINMDQKEHIKIASTGICNEGHTFIFTVNSHLYSSGNNGFGAFGNGETSNYGSTFTKIENEMTLSLTSNDSIIDIQCGAHHSLFLTFHGILWSAGYNAAGQCGAPKKMGKKFFSPHRVKTPNDIKIIKIVCGQDHNLAINEHFDLITFGDNEFGQQGTDVHGDIYTPIFNAFFRDQHIKIRDIACGRDHSLCLDMNGNCYTFGDNLFGQIGDGSIDNHMTKPFDVFKNKHQIVEGCCGYAHNVLLTRSNHVICFGNNRWQQCSSIVEADVIITPHILSKYNELHVPNHALVENVLASAQETIIILNPISQCT
eukprot:83898_1